MKRYTLPISPNYVAHWGLWEALREVIQNALDAATSDPACEVQVKRNGGNVRISTTRGHLLPKTLLLGQSTKTGNPDQRGQYGEGYKLALLVLTRLGHEVCIYNDTEVWTPKIEHDKEFDADVLRIYVEPVSVREGDGVTFVVKNVTDEQWEEVCRNYRPNLADAEMILESDDEKGRIYIGGLYVTTMKDFHAGYAFRPSTISLDRDRSMVCGYDISTNTSRLWSQVADSDRAYELIEARAPDVEYVVHHARKESPATAAVQRQFTARHGNAVPVSTQAEVQRATAAGLKWVLVPASMKAMLGKVMTLFIPSGDPPALRLENFVASYRWRMTDEMREEIDDILRVLKGQHDAAADAAQQIEALSNVPAPSNP